MKQKTCISVHTGEKVLIFCAGGFLPGPKTAERGKFEGVFVIGVKLKQYNFRQWKSFCSIVDIQSMCLLYMSFGGGCMVWVL